MTQLFIYSNEKSFNKDGKERKFTTYYTKMEIVVKGEESKGLQKKSITCKFIEDVVLPDGLKQKDIKRGILEVPDDKIFIPYVYEVKEVEGKKEYPTIWIREVSKYIHKPYEFKDKPKFIMEEESDEDFEQFQAEEIDD